MQPGANKISVSASIGSRAENLSSRRKTAAALPAEQNPDRYGLRLRPRMARAFRGDDPGRAALDVSNSPWFSRSGGGRPRKHAGGRSGYDSSAMADGLPRPGSRNWHEAHLLARV